MNLFGYEGMKWNSLLVCVLVYLMVELVNGNVVLMGRNVSLSFEDVEASFTPMIKGSGECGMLYVSKPLNACTPLAKNVTANSKSAFVLIIRGGCSFDDKVRQAQNAGFKTAIVYDSQDDGALVSMAGSSTGIHIHAVFVSKASGEMLYRYAGREDVELWVIPSHDDSWWSIMGVSFISLLAISAVLATCFFVRRHRIRHEQNITPNSTAFHGMSSQLVKAMPSLIFEVASDDSCTSTTCAICLDDYDIGDKLRVLPCRHKFHALCVDLWLTSWRTFCPVCKQDARVGVATHSASEHTPLLSSSALSPSGIEGLSSFRSSVAASPAVPIIPRPPQSHTNSRPQSISNSYISAANRSFNQSPTFSISRSSADLRNASLLRFQCQPQSTHSFIPSLSRSYNHSSAISISRSTLDFRNSALRRSNTRSYIIPPSSLPFPMSSPIAVNYVDPHIDSSSVGSSSSLAASSGRPSYLRHFTDSATSLPALASAHSLPGC